MIDKELNDIVRRLETVGYQQTFDGHLQWYYADEGLYVFKINAGTKDEYLGLIRAESLEAARAKVNVTSYQDVPDDPRDEIKRLNARIDELQCKNIEMFQIIRKVYRVMKDGYDGFGYKILSDYFNKLIQKPVESVKSV